MALIRPITCGSHNTDAVQAKPRRSSNFINPIFVISPYQIWCQAKDAAAIKRRQRILLDFHNFMQQKSTKYEPN